MTTTTTTPAAVLRSAASRVRELGTAARSDGWTADATTVFEDDEGVAARCTFPEDAAWIALLSPAVAEPLAAWLEAQARSFDLPIVPADSTLRERSPQYRLARALLGETS